MKQRLLETADYLEMEAIDADRFWSGLANLCATLLRALAEKEKGKDE